MKIESELVPVSTLEAFSDKHGLVMQVFERSADFVRMAHIGPGGRFFAHFKNVDVKDGAMLRGVFGDGATEAEALADYAREISEKLLVVDSGMPERREIKVPRLSYQPGAAAATQPHDAATDAGDAT